jgi:DNA-binding transcriptional regulator YdaS (Cro superfamily)
VRKKEDFFMKLRDYLHFERIKITEFAKRIGYHKAYITDICNDRHIPSKRLATSIEFATAGKVTLADLIPLIQPKEEEIEEEIEPLEEKIG